MKLLRLGPVDAEVPAVLVDDEHAVDVSSLVDDFDHAFFATGGPGRLATALASDGDALPRIPLRSTRIGSCIARPGQIIGIGLNYLDHAEESGAEPPPEPILFSKSPHSISGPYDDVLLPVGAEKVDWEVEFGVVIGRRASRLASVDEALDHVAGYCVVNDISERAWQLEGAGKQWLKGKSADTFAPVGPWLVTADEVPDPQSLELFLDLNGEPMQRGSGAKMIFGVAHVIWHVSQFLTLHPGDLIATGTPAGVGLGQRPQRYLRDGDVLELGVTGLGSQRQTCRRAPARG
jgi:2-keto-4-pentenoate hydratase/2-oxohepta-3-ene-1,7-dioic acid hydratase in catechol pathway